MSEGRAHTKQQETRTLKRERERERVTFFRAEYSSEGMHPDPKKVQETVEMTLTGDKQQL